MTRKLYLVNMSNHENEEYDISTNGQEIVNLVPGDKIEVEDASNGAERIAIEIHRLNNPDAPRGYNPPSLPEGMEDDKEEPTVEKFFVGKGSYCVRLSNGDTHSWTFSDLEAE